MTMAEDGLTEERVLATPEQVLGLTVQHPSVGVCVVTMDGELDMLTAPLLEACLRQQFAAAPAHLILDLEALRFLGSNGLTCLLWAREFAHHSTGTQLHLAGLATRVVARALQITQLQDQFDTYPTLPHALAALNS